MVDENLYPPIITKVRITREDNPILYDIIAKTSLRKRAYKVQSFATLYLEAKTDAPGLRLQIEGAAPCAAPPAVDESLGRTTQDPPNKVSDSEPVDECIDNYLDSLSR